MLFSDFGQYVLAHLLIAVLPITIGFLVFAQRPENTLYRIFLLYHITISWWGIFTLFMEFSPTATAALFWDQVSLIGIVFIPSTFLHFTLRYLDEDSKVSWLVKLSYFLSSCFALAVFTPLMVVGVSRKHFVPFFTDPGPLYPVFLVFFASIMSLALLFCYRGYLQRRGSKQERPTFMFFTVALIAIAGGGGNFFVSYNIFVPVLIPYGSYGVVIYAVVTGYLIARHRFLDIEIIIKKTLIFASLFGVALGLFSFISFLATDVLQQLLGPGGSRFSLLAIAATLVVMGGRKLETVLATATDRFLFQKKFDYRKVLKYASQGLSRVNSLRYQLKLVTCFLTMRARIKTAAVYMPETENGDDGKSDFTLREFRAFDTSDFGPDRLAFDSPIVSYLRKETKKPFLELYEVEDLARRHQKERAPIYRYDFEKMRDEMRQRKASLIVASYYQDRLQGILMLGEKRSEEPYGEEDIHLFQTVAQETAIAFENARKHDKLVEQKEELERANLELKKMEATVIQAKEEAAVAELSGGISHDVGNGVFAQEEAFERLEAALNGIAILFKELYGSHRSLSAAQKAELFEYLEDALQALYDAKEAAKHIEDVARSLSQLAKGEYAEMSRLDLRTTLKGLVRIGAMRTYDQRVHAQALDREPEVIVPRDLPPIRGHARLLRAVFVNLFKNSIDALKDISPKVIKIEAMRDPEDKNMCRIEFSDNGCGIPREHLPRIFDYNFTTKGARGEGKGLFNVKAIIENEHGGKIDVVSEVGKGTTFIIKIPFWTGKEQVF